MRWPKWTIRRIMLVSLAFAVVLGLGIPAASAWRRENWHVHTFVIRPDDDEEPSTSWENVREPFLTRYLRSLGGRDPAERRRCVTVLGGIEEVCSLEFPEIVSDGSVNVDTPRQVAAVERLQAEQTTRRARADFEAWKRDHPPQMGNR